MNQLYCGACQNYLMGSDGECHDCSCGWKVLMEFRDWYRNVRPKGEE